MTTLQAFLDRPSNPAHVLRYHELQGFIFAMVAGPVMIETRQWTMLLVPEMDDETYDQFCDLYGEIEDGVRAGTPALPADCPLLPDPLSNLEPSAPLSQWSRGFFNGQKLFAQAWADFYRDCANADTDAVKAFGRALVHLNFFSSREIAELYSQEPTPRPLAEAAAEACANFETDMGVYAMFLRPWRERADGAGPERRPVRSPSSAPTRAPESKAHLKAFFDESTGVPDIFSYHKLQGFMFGVVCAPRVVEPHEWLLLVMGEQSPMFYMHPPKELMDEMRDLYREIEARVERGATALPPDCPMAPDPMANLDPAAPLSQWSQGLYAAHNWLANDWMSVLRVLTKEDPRMATQLAGSILHLLCFASPELADQLSREWGKGTKEALVADAHREFQVGMVAYAELGRGFRLAPKRAPRPDARFTSSSAPRPITRGKTVGRNEPCPCGSGRKYKKCCGAVH